MPAFIDSARSVLEPAVAAAGAATLDGGVTELVTARTSVEPARLRDRLAERNRRAAELLALYPNEPGRIDLGKLRIPYAHQVWHASAAGAPWLAARTTRTPYDVDAALGVPGFRDRACEYRVRAGHALPWPGSAVRVSAWSESAGFGLQPASYVDQFVTNQAALADAPLRAVDPRLTSQEGATLRALDAQDGRLPTFGASKLANTIGIATSVATRDGFLILPLRNARVHVNEGRIGSSASGVLEWSEQLAPELLPEATRQLLANEVASELRLDAGASVTLLAFARELERAGKPQLFFHTFADTTLAELRQRWTSDPSAALEADALFWIQLFESAAAEDAARRALAVLAALLDPSKLPQLAGRPLLLSEEARASALYLALLFAERGRAAFPSAWLT